MLAVVIGLLLLALASGLAGFGGLAGEGAAGAQRLFVASASMSAAALLLRAFRWPVPPDRPLLLDDARHRGFARSQATLHLLE